jgi:hypothetical protein
VGMAYLTIWPKLAAALPAMVGRIGALLIQDIVSAKSNLKT